MQGVSEFEVAGLKAVGKLTATRECDVLDEADVVVVCVPTPLNKTRDPDVSFILQACGAIKDRLRRGQLVILESTTYPGTTHELVLPLARRKWLEGRSRFFYGIFPRARRSRQQGLYHHQHAQGRGGVLPRLAQK